MYCTLYLCKVKSIELTVIRLPDLQVEMCLAVTQEFE